ncbi:MAG: hypothetical protein ABIT96_03915, partial [Ferruginibacter sp.]
CMTAAESQGILNGNFNIVPIFASAPVPLSGIELKAAWDNQYASLEFEAFENDRFENYLLERSVNARTFNPVNNIVNNTNATQQIYRYQDTRISASEVYYRIKGITRQGATEYSNIVKLKNSDTQDIRIYPNPVTNFRINLEFIKPIYEHIEITIYGTRGEKLYYNQLNPTGNRYISFNVPSLFSVKTMYVLNILYSGTVINEKIFFE